MSFNGRVRSHGRLLQNCVTRYSAFILLVVLICNGSFSAAERIPVEDTSAEKRLKVLLITAAAVTIIRIKKNIREGLSKHCDNLDWTVLEYGSQRDLKIDVYKRSDWIKGYDLVIHNECYGGVEDPDFVNGLSVVTLSIKYRQLLFIVRCTPIEIPPPRISGELCLV